MKDIKEIVTIHGTGDNRVLQVPINQLHRFQFKHKVDGQKRELKFKAIGNNAYAAAGSVIYAWGKPNANAFHREYMRQNGLALYRGEPGCDSERLLENMLEFLETL